MTHRLKQIISTIADYSLWALWPVVAVAWWVRERGKDGK
jgi:hypothetical protein